VADRLPPPPKMGDPLPIAAAPEVLRFLARRRSASAVTLREPGPTAAELEDLIQIATRAPDHGKLSPWRFLVFQGEAKAAYAHALERIAARQDDPTCLPKLVKVKAPPLCVAVISSPKAAKIPEWEQRLSAGAVCVNLAYAAQAMGYGANWITDWYAYEPEALALLRLAPGERVAGFVMIGTAGEAPLERERPDPAALVSAWTP